MLETREHFSDKAGARSLWIGVLAAPVAFLVDLEASYILVPQACATGVETGLHLVPILALLVTAAGTIVSWRNWKRTGEARSEGEETVVTRSHFMAVWGTLMSLLFFLVILAQWIPSLFFSPCQR